MLQIQAYAHSVQPATSIDGDVIQKINGDFKGKDIVSLDQFSVEDLRILFSLTRKMKRSRCIIKHPHCSPGILSRCCSLSRRAGRSDRLQRQ